MIIKANSSNNCKFKKITILKMMKVTLVNRVIQLIRLVIKITIREIREKENAIERKMYLKFFSLIANIYFRVCIEFY